MIGWYFTSCALSGFMIGIFHLLTCISTNLFRCSISNSKNKHFHSTDTLLRKCKKVVNYLEWKGVRPAEGLQRGCARNMKHYAIWHCCVQGCLATFEALINYSISSLWKLNPKHKRLKRTDPLLPLQQEADPPTCVNPSSLLSFTLHSLYTPNQS